MINFVPKIVVNEENIHQVMNHLGRLLVIMFVCIGGRIAAFADAVPYAVWCSGNTTLYFVNSETVITAGDTYDGQTVTNVWSGDGVLDTKADAPGWVATVKATLTTVVFDESFSAVMPNSLFGWFDGATLLENIVNLSYLDTRRATRMGAMFRNCKKLTSLDLSNFDTRLASNAHYMFYGCEALETITFGENFRLDGKNANEEYGVTLVSKMFYNCKKLNNIDLSRFAPLPGDLSEMFYGCAELTSVDLSSFKTRNVTTVSKMFANCSKLESVTLGEGFTLPKATDMSRMFYNCNALRTLDLGKVETKSVTTLERMFCNCKSLTTLDLGRFDTSNVTDMQYLFSSNSNLTTVYVGAGWNTGNVTVSTGIMNFCSKLVGGNGSIWYSTYADISYAKIDNKDGTRGYFTAKIELDDTKDNSALLTSLNGCQNSSVTINRTIYRDGGWNTLCLPVAMTASEVTASFGTGTKVMKFKQDRETSGNTYLTFDDVSSEGMSAGVPYLVKTGTVGSALTTLYFTDKTIVGSTTVDSEGTSITFKGLLSPTQIVNADTDVSTILYIGAEAKFSHPAAYDSSKPNAGKMKAFRAYFQTEGSSDASRMFCLGLDEETVTTVQPVVSRTDKKPSDDVYTLQGCKVSGDQLQKGIYIIGGRKYIHK